MNKVYNSLKMEQQLSEQNTVAKEEERAQNEGHLSKSKQMLKKCINEIGSIRDSKGVSLPAKTVHKIAAPKPVRASRPITLNHLGNSKWLQTSPIKNEMGSEQSTSDRFQESESQLKLAWIPSQQSCAKKITFQNEQKVSYLEDHPVSSESDLTSAKKNLPIRKHSPMSELQSLMEAEQELSQIFQRSMDFKHTAGGCHLQPEWAFFSPDISYSSSISCASSSNNGASAAANLDQKCYEEGSQQSNPGSSVVGFSKYGHFKAPIKRPSCNPIVKDERFKRLNTVNDGNLGFQVRLSQGAIPCDSQALIHPATTNTKDLSSNCLLNMHQQSNFMFAPYSQTTSPTAYSSSCRGEGRGFDFGKANNGSHFNPFSFNETVTTNSAANSSWLNGSIYPQHSHFNPQQQHLQQIQMTSSTQQQHHQQQLYSSMNPMGSTSTTPGNLNLANSAPEANQQYLSHYMFQQQQQQQQPMQQQPMGVQPQLQLSTHDFFQPTQMYYSPREPTISGSFSLQIE